MSPDRLTCIVAACRRSIGRSRIPEHHDEWICPIHWRAVPKVLKRIKARHDRQFRRFGFYPAESAYNRAWRMIVKSAEEVPMK